jgi:hypothetical protein
VDALSVRLGVALLLASGCSKAQGDLPLDKVEPSVLEREKAKIARGDVVGEELRTPRIAVDANGVRVGEHGITARTDLRGTPPRLVASLFTWMHGMRDHWKAVHPGKDFAADVDLTLPIDLDFDEGANLIDTLAHAGYASAIHVHLGAMTATIRYAIAGPIVDYVEEPPPKHAAGFWESPLGWKARRDRVKETELVKCTPWQSVDRTSASAVASSICGGPCDVVVVKGKSRFEDALHIAAAALGASTSVRFEGVEPCP